MALTLLSFLSVGVLLFLHLLLASFSMECSPQAPTDQALVQEAVDLDVQGEMDVDKDSLPPTPDHLRAEWEACDLLLRLFFLLQYCLLLLLFD